MIVRGLQVVFTPHAVEKTDERLFPFSRHRSRRVLKKLIKRFGAEFRTKPAMYRVGNKLLAHPALQSEIVRIAAPEPPHGR